ncbi:protein kinase domain-containing protein [Nocardia sp. CA-145437]|uniref:serine/threonine-protein kinase n=1 Tax=Nocardia sp. CA-145437 TaxID=3239980 RepID=UPI003D980040
MPGAGNLGHYRLVELLGRGGMGQVWLAEDTRLEREVALKLLPAELAADEDYRRRFEREARLAARLRGPHVVPIHAFGELDGRLYIDMELIDGSDLGKTLRAEGAMTPGRAVELVSQIAEALDIAHKAGLVHRDVKPSNVLTLPNGFAYLIDFGIARGVGQATITGTGVAVGTWAYMAPERYSGTEDLRSDVYSLACLLYETLTAAKPFAHADPVQQMAAHLTTDPPRAADRNPRVSAALDAVIARGMAKDPDHRFSSAGALAAAARTALESTPAPRQAPHRRAEPTAKWDGADRFPSHTPTPASQYTPYTPPPGSANPGSIPGRDSGPSSASGPGSDSASGPGSTPGPGPGGPASYGRSAVGPAPAPRTRTPSGATPPPSRLNAGATPPPSRFGAGTPPPPGRIAAGGALPSTGMGASGGMSPGMGSGATPPPGVMGSGGTPLPGVMGGSATSLPGVMGGGAAPLPGGTAAGVARQPGGMGSAGRVEQPMTGALGFASPHAAGYGGAVAKPVRRQGIRPWQPVWWAVLGLGVLFFGIMSVGVLAVTFSEGFDGWLETLIAYLIFVAPFAGSIWVTVLEVRRFRARG